MRIAVLKLAAGDVTRLRVAMETAKKDYRDVLAPAEYPEYLRAIGPSSSMTPEEIERIVDADWEQYSEWLHK